MPATNASSERSFSALRRVKSYLRSTMLQERLNYLSMFIKIELTSCASKLLLMNSYKILHIDQNFNFDIAIIIANT